MLLSLTEIGVNQVITLVIVGLMAGTLGGLFGIGGSLLIIPAMAIVFGPNQHLYQASAMIVNIFVAMPAAYRHWRAGAVQWNVMAKLLPFAVVMIIAGVLVSDRFDGKVLQQVFGVFLLYVIAINLMKIFSRNGEDDAAAARPTWTRTGIVGSIMGFLAGLLGIGGGVVLVPLLQRVCHLPLKQCIATSSALMCLSSIFGAVAKNSTLDQHPDVQNPTVILTPTDAIFLAMWLLPTAVVGGLIGATMTHSLPLKWVRAAFVLLLLWASGRLLGLI